MAGESVLTFQIVEDLWLLFSPKTIYYFEERFCRKVDKGKPVLFQLPILGQKVWVLHPDNLPRFLDVARQAGLIPVKFDFEKASRRIQPKWEVT